MSADKVFVEKVINENKTMSKPLLLNFQNGELNRDSDSSLFLATDQLKKDKIISVLATKGSIYTGETKEDGTDLVNTYVAIRNKTNNKVRFIQVNEVSLKNHIYHKDDGESFQTMSVQESWKTLLKDFGGRNAARYLDRAERTKINLDIVKTQLAETVGDYEILSGDDEEILNNEEVLPHIRPICNKLAKKLDDVYNIKDIISEELLDRLDEEAAAIISAKLELIPIQSEYILQKITEIKESATPSSESNLIAIKICIYMDALRALIKLREKNLEKANLSNITEKVENDIRVKFAQPKTMILQKTKFTLHKAVCYFIVLALITGKEFQLNINTLVQELSIPRKDLIKFAHLVNAKLKGTTDTLYLRLPGQIKPLRLSLGKRKHRN